MNYININDAFNISRVLTEEGNIYGFNSLSTDSHLMKNSEWGAVAYLGHSEYGLNKQGVYLNNINLNNSTQSIYAVTGVTTGTTGANAKTTTIENIKSIIGNNPNSDGVYLWNQIEGQKASSTGNMYGIFDLSGGSIDFVSSYIANGNSSLKNHGASLAYEGENLKTVSTKYVTVYLKSEQTSENADTQSQYNYEANSKKIGEAIYEISEMGYGTTGWYENTSNFPSKSDTFMRRGNRSWEKMTGGLFAFSHTVGDNLYNTGFRAVLINK